MKDQESACNIKAAHRPPLIRAGTEAANLKYPRGSGCLLKRDRSLPNDSVQFLTVDPSSRDVDLHPAADANFTARKLHSQQNFSTLKFHHSVFFPLIRNVSFFRPCPKILQLSCVDAKSYGMSHAEGISIGVKI